MDPSPARRSALDHDDDLLALGESIVFKEIEGGAGLKAHVFFPPDPVEAPVAGRTAMIFFFGSGWDSGRVTQFAPQALHFASRGAMTVLVEYRTRSSHGATPVAAMQDARSAIRWVRFYSSQLGIDPRRIVAVGALAGGNIAAAAAMKADLRDDETDPPHVSGAPDALVLLNPLVEVVKRGYGAAAFADTGTPLAEARLEPHAAPDLPPMLILQGTRDLFSPFEAVLSFVRKMQRLDNICDLLPFEGRQHSYFNLNVDPANYDLSNGQIDRFLVQLGFFPEAGRIEAGIEEVRVLP